MGYAQYAGVGLGLDVPMTKFGTTSAIGHPAAIAGGTCGDSFAVQQMLKDLGFYSGAIDGQIGNQTFAALKAFGAPATFPNATTCQALISAWQAAQTPIPAPVPGLTTPAPTPLKLRFPPSMIKCMQTGGKWANGACSIPASVPGASGAGTWWSGLTQTEKIGVIGTGVLVLGAIIWMAKPAKKATPNRRRRRKARRNHAPYSVYERALFGSRNHRDRGTFEDLQSAVTDAYRAETYGEDVFIKDGHGKVVYDTRWRRQ